MPPPFFRFSRPRSFLHLIPLGTATEFITFTLAINKITGLYGILALFTGYHLNPLQLSHYIYSLLVLGLICWLSPAIKQRDADGVLKMLALAWVYVLDTVVNSAYTALFGLGWFVVLARHLNEDARGGAGIVPGGKTVNDTAGFTDPEHEVSQVDIIATPAHGALTGQHATAYSTSGTLGGAMFGMDGMSSITVLGLLWLIRIYFCVVVLSFARSTIRQHIAATSTSYSASEDPTMAENPFRPGRAEGEGWRGKVGRFMLRFPTPRYWIGKNGSEDGWVKQTSSRLENARGLRIKVPDGGLGERERRARSGTGPPPPVGVKGKVPD